MAADTEIRLHPLSDLELPDAGLSRNFFNPNKKKQKQVSSETTKASRNQAKTTDPSAAD
jgi:hypothetical protein